jgi:hypothetical protein
VLRDSPLGIPLFKDSFVLKKIYKCYVLRAIQGNQNKKRKCVHIQKTVKMPDGAELTLFLNETEVQFVLEVGLNFLAARGAIPIAEVPYPLTKEEIN